MKIEAIVFIAIIVVASFALPILAKADEETRNQRLISHIRWSPTRLKTFCQASELTQPFYEQKICRNADDCEEFIRKQKDLRCEEQRKSIISSHYESNFASMKAYLREHGLGLLSRRKDHTSTVSTTTVSTTTVTTTTRLTTIPTTSTTRLTTTTIDWIPLPKPIPK